MFKRLLPIALATSIPAACAYPSINQIKNPPPVNVAVNVEKAVPIEVVRKSWKLTSGSKAEHYILAELQDKTKITDRNALATILGNIKSESGFRPNVCEGGAIVPYQQCRRGGYGLIQWTTKARYSGLGKFCKKYGCNPSSLEGQTRYMINESHFQKVLPEFEGRGMPVHQYMVAAYYWLGWGIKGNREHYAYEYAGKLVYRA